MLQLFTIMEKLETNEGYQEKLLIDRWTNGQTEDTQNNNSDFTEPSIYGGTIPNIDEKRT